jgi:hypothetical protein
MKVRTGPHGRIKERYNPVPNAEEARHEARLRELPCIGCGRHGVEMHHLMQQCQGKRFRRDHRFQLPVCPKCHRGHQSIHGIGDERAWCEGKGIDGPDLAVRLWEESNG